MKAISIIISGILCGIAFTAASENKDKNHDYYIQLSAGNARGQNSKGAFAQGSLGDSSLYAIETGYKINDHFRASLSLDFRPNFKNNHSLITYHYDPDDAELHIITANHHTKVRSLVAMLNIYYDITEINKFTPYLVLGAGLANNRTISSANVTTISGYNKIPYNNTDAPTKKTTDSFACKAGLGVTHAVSKKLNFDIHYQFAYLGSFKTTNPSVKRGRLKSHEVLLGIAYKF